MIYSFKSQQYAGLLFQFPVFDCDGLLIAWFPLFINFFRQITLYHSALWFIKFNLFNFPLRHFAHHVVSFLLFCLNAITCLLGIKTLIQGLISSLIAINGL